MSLIIKTHTNKFIINCNAAIEEGVVWGYFTPPPLRKNPQRRNISPQATSFMTCLVADKTQLETQRDQNRNVADFARCVSVG